jgi:hypothetical protein
MYGSFVLLEQSGKIARGERVHVGETKGRNEAWLRNMLFNFPEIVPTEDIDPTFSPLIPLCKELRTEAGLIDATFVNERGRLTIVECKLWKNPQSRREVVAQTLHYVSALSEWTYADLQRQVSAALRVVPDPAKGSNTISWRHISELLNATKSLYSELKNLCVWNKTNGGMGSFYRSKHELIFVFKVGTASHINNIDLGRSGRYRTNVWDYGGVNSFGRSRLEELAMHPTVKPVVLVADAIKDCSRRKSMQI